MFIKLYCNSKIHKISKIPETFCEFQEKVSAIFTSEVTDKDYSFSYQDEEGDKIALTNEDDYQTMVKTDLVSTANITLKVFLTLQPKTSPDVTSQRNEDLNQSRQSRDHELSDGSERIGSHSPVEQSTAGKKPLKSILKKKTAELASIAPKKEFYQARVINDCKSLIGDRFEICKNSLITITRFLQAKGQVEAEYNGQTGVFNLRDIQIQTKNCSAHVNKPLVDLSDELNFRRVQFGY